MKVLAPAIVSLIVAVSVAGYFGGYVPYPFQFAPPPSPISPTSPISPITYAPTGDMPLNMTYSIVTQGGITVYEYWASWNHDGPTCCYDVEPVFVYYLGGSSQPFAEAQRVHYQWRVKYNGFVMLGDHPVWSYETSYHTPSLGYPIPGEGSESLTGDNWIQAPPPVNDCGISGPCNPPIDPFSIIGPQAQLERALLFGVGSFAAIFIVGLTLVNSVLPRLHRRK